MTELELAETSDTFSNERLLNKVQLEPTSTEREAGALPEHPAPAPALRFSEELDRLIGGFGKQDVRLRDVLEVTQSRGYTILLILLTLPFCTPIPVPGFSTPFGLVMAVIGLRLTLGQKPWLPVRLLNTRLPAGFVPRVLGAARWLVRRLEWLLKPRFGQLLRWRPMRHGMGAAILVCGLLLLLPLPIFFSNCLPALTVLLFALAMLEEDGCFALAGIGMFVLTLAFFGLIFWGGAEAAAFLKDGFGDMFNRQNAPPGSL